MNEKPRDQSITVCSMLTVKAVKYREHKNFNMLACKRKALKRLECKNMSSVNY